MLSLWANWLVTKFGLNSLKRYLWPVLYLIYFPPFFGGGGRNSIGLPWEACLEEKNKTGQSCPNSNHHDHSHTFIAAIVTVSVSQCDTPGGGGGGGGSLPLEAVPDAREKNPIKKGIQIRGGHRIAKRVSKTQKMKKRVGLSKSLLS